MDLESTIGSPTKALKSVTVDDESQIVTDAPLEPAMDFTERANEQMNS